MFHAILILCWQITYALQYNRQHGSHQYFQICVLLIRLQVIPCQQDHMKLLFLEVASCMSVRCMQDIDNAGRNNKSLLQDDIIFKVPDLTKERVVLQVFANLFMGVI